MYTRMYQELRSKARNRGMISYSELGRMVGLDMANPADRTEMSNLLGEISQAEVNEARPMLSAVVVHSDSHMPGKGFFDLARALGLHPGGEDIVFFAQELQRVHDHWANH